MTKNLVKKSIQSKTTEDLESKPWLIFDLESDGLYDDVTKVYCLVIYDIHSRRTFSYGPDSIDDALSHLAKAACLIGHNIIFYDLPVLKKLYSIDFSARVVDTLICSRLIWPKEILYDNDCEQHQEVPQNLKGGNSLKAWGYRLSDHKIEFTDFTEYSQEMLDYCVQDVRVTEKLWTHINKQNYPESALALEHDFAQAINKQVRSGVPFAVDACLDLVDHLRAKKGTLETKLKTIFPPIRRSQWFTPKVNNKKRGYIKGLPTEKCTYEEFNPGSRKQIIERLQTKYKWVPTKFTDKRNPILDDKVIGQLPYPEAKPLAEYMLIKKRLGQIADGKNAWLKLVNNETGRIHGDVITNGCITGRCSHRNPNCSQVPRSSSPYGEECRALFHAPYDWDMIGFDAKGLELRCLAAYLAIWDNGEYSSIVTDEKEDVHSYNQKQFGVSSRDVSKTLIYAMMYGSGSEKAGKIIEPNEKNVDRLKKLGRETIEQFKKSVPAYSKLTDQIKETLSKRGYLIGLDKRILHCRSDFKGLNVLLQSAGAIIMKKVVVNIHKNIETNLGLEYGDGWEQLLMVHDEVQITCLKQHTEKISNEVLKAFGQAEEFFGFRCKIEGDSKIGTNWSETH
jgi:hypothetical protein